MDSKKVLAQIIRLDKSSPSIEIDEQAGSYTTNFNSSTENERDLLCSVVEIAARDYLEGCEEAAEFFFAEDSDIQEYFFDHLDIDFDYFIRLLKEKRLKSDAFM